MLVAKLKLAMTALLILTFTAAGGWLVAYGRPGPEPSEPVKEMPVKVPLPAQKPAKEKAQLDPRAKQKPAAQTVDALDITSAYHTNEARADEQFTDKQVTFTGSVIKVRRAPQAKVSYVLVLEPLEPKHKIRLLVWFDATAQEQLAKLKTFDRVTVDARCVGRDAREEDYETIVFHNGKLLKTESAPTGGGGAPGPTPLEPSSSGRGGGGPGVDADAPERMTDAEFIRRVYLDLRVVAPSAEELTRFAQDKSPDKRKKLVDWLVARELQKGRLDLPAVVDSVNAETSTITVRDTTVVKLLEAAFLGTKVDRKFAEAWFEGAMSRKPTTLVNLHITKDAKITDGAKEIKLADLKVGMRITLQLTVDQNRGLVVNAICAGDESADRKP